MDSQRTQTVSASQPPPRPFAPVEENGERGRVEQLEQFERLNVLLGLNAEISREKALYRSRREEFEAALMRHPVPVKKAFGYFGLMLGTFPPAALFSKAFTKGSDEVGLFLLLLLVNILCAVAGYFSGKLIGDMVREAETRSWSVMLLLLPLIGALWGIITGAAGGVLIFVVGAYFGAAVAAMVGSVAVPLFTIFHRLLKKGEMIERNQFLPLALGVALVVSAFILGL